MLWGHRNDPVNFHRCLQDFDRRLPDLLDALRDRRPADPHLRPRLRPDDAVDRPLARARAAARVRRTAGTRRAASTSGEFADVGATVNAWLGGKQPRRGHSRPADRRAVRARTTRQLVRREYADGGRPRRQARRAAALPRAGQTRVDIGVRRGGGRRRRGGCWRSAAATGELAERIARERRRRRSSRSIISPRMVELTRGAGIDARVGDVQALPFARPAFDCAVAAWMLYHVPDLDRALRELARVLEPRRDARRGTNVGAEHMRELWELVGGTHCRSARSRGRTARSFCAGTSRACGATDVDATAALPGCTRRARPTSTRRSFSAEASRPLPDFEGPFRSSARATVFVAERVIRPPS